MAVVTGHSAVLTGSGDPEKLRGFDVGADFFSILGVKPLRGRSTFTPEDSAWKGTMSVLVNETLWRTRFGGDSGLVGKMVTLDNQRYQVAGIIPAASAWPANTMLWYPFTYDPAQLQHSRGAVYLNVVARLKPGATLAGASADMNTIAKRLEQQYPDADAKVGAIVVPMQDWITGSLRLPLLTLLGGVAFVLLIACANVANLLLVRGVAREGELAVRTALGAGRGRLIRQLVTESMVLSLIGGGAGFLLAIVGTRFLVAGAPPSIPRLDAIHVDIVVLGFTLLIATVTGAVFGLVPARQMVRPDIAKTLREGGRSGGQRSGSHAARRALVVAEVALSMMLLAGAGLLIRSFNSLMAVDPGFRTENSISFALSLPDAKYRTPAEEAAFMSRVMERMHALAGVQSAGAGFGMPLTNFGFDFTFKVTGRPPLKPADQPDAEVRVATPDYFPTMGIRIVKGRGFTDLDRDGGAKVLLLTETAAKSLPGRGSARQARDVRHRTPPGRHTRRRHRRYRRGREAVVTGRRDAAAVLGSVRPVADVVHERRAAHHARSAGRRRGRARGDQAARSRPRGGAGEDARRRAGRVRRPAALLYGLADRVRTRRDRALRNRDLRRGRVPGRTAFARARDSHRTRCDAVPRRAARGPRGSHDGRSGNRRRSGRCARAHAANGCVAVQCQTHRSRDCMWPSRRCLVS